MSFFILQINTLPWPFIAHYSDSLEVALHVLSLLPHLHSFVSPLPSSIYLWHPTKISLQGHHWPPCCQIQWILRPHPTSCWRHPPSPWLPSSSLEVPVLLYLTSDLGQSPDPVLDGLVYSNSSNRYRHTLNFSLSLVMSSPFLPC